MTSQHPASFNSENVAIPVSRQNSSTTNEIIAFARYISLIELTAHSTCSYNRALMDTM